MTRHTYMILVLVVLGAVACREARHVGPEDLILNSVEEPVATVTQVIKGIVSCTTCKHSTTAMIIEVWLPERGEMAPIARKPYGVLGGYEVEVTVPYNELLELRVEVFAESGMRSTTKQVRATNNTQMVRAETSVDLIVEE